jgi:hypothetical protein
MIYTPSEIHKKIAAVAPLISVSMGSWADKSTWTIEYTATASDDEKAAAQAMIDALDLVATPIAMAHRSMSTPDFFDSLTEEELAAIEDSTNAQIIRWRKKLPLCSVVEIDSEESEALQALLISLGLLSSERIAEIFA